VNDKLEEIKTDLGEIQTEQGNQEGKIDNIQLNTDNANALLGIIDGKLDDLSTGIGEIGNPGDTNGCNVNININGCCDCTCDTPPIDPTPPGETPEPTDPCEAADNTLVH
jgi:hypothetical protein